jgi:hypothetical protein
MTMEEIAHGDQDEAAVNQIQSNGLQPFGPD